MCGRFVLVDWDGLEHRFMLPNSSLALVQERYADLERMLPPRYNIAPTQGVLTIIHDAASGERRAAMMRWGLVPSWAKDVAIGSRMINARAETLAERPAFRSAFRRRRCLIIADSFYEWSGEGRGRLPMRIGLKSGEKFAFAGLWEEWERDGVRMQSCALVTTQANAFMEPIHSRMPVILRREDEGTWLDTSIDDPLVLSCLLAPYPSESMTAHRVSRLVNSPANDGPECIVPVTALL